MAVDGEVKLIDEIRHESPSSPKILHTVHNLGNFSSFIANN